MEGCGISEIGSDRPPMAPRSAHRERAAVAAAVRAKGASAVKRLFDVAGAALLLALLSPFILVVAVVVKLDSRGPVFFRCERVGLRGRELRMLKFRKMADGAGGPALTAADDPRFTRVGRWLARSKVDELPQLWNVLMGEMSLVGPRPEHPSFVSQRPPDFAEILSVRPGITGLSQLAFAREAEILDTRDQLADYVRRVLPQKVALDQLYVRTWTPLMDAKILLWTAVAVLAGGEVAVRRTDGGLGSRRRPAAQRSAAVVRGDA